MAIEPSLDNITSVLYYYATIGIRFSANTMWTIMLFWFNMFGIRSPALQETPDTTFQFFVLTLLINYRDDIAAFDKMMAPVIGTLWFAS